MSTETPASFYTTIAATVAAAKAPVIMAASDEPPQFALMMLWYALAGLAFLHQHGVRMLARVLVIQPGLIGQVRINGEQVTLFPPIELQPGDVVELHLAGGGGFGPVEQRDPALVLADLQLGLISREAARDVYRLPAQLLPA
jgi:hypothetical protein